MPSFSLDRRSLALLVGIATAISTWLAWGSLRPIPLVQDEYSYVLQARIFATGHWTAPPPPVQSSFQQSHVIITPRVASKYPPGHALLLTPGALVGAPWLVPLLLAGIAGALIFLLIDRFLGPWCALFGWACWLGDPMGLRFFPGYFSESTSSVAWLATWWFLLDWRDTRRRRSLLAIAVAMGWLAITRPFTALIFAIPVGAYLLWHAVREKRWQDLALATAVGTAIVLIFPLSNIFTTGHPFESAFALYREQYLPFDKLGFGLDSTPPREVLGAVNAETFEDLRKLHVNYTPAALPHVAFDRLRELARLQVSRGRVVLLPFLAAGLVGVGGELWFALLCAATLFAGYLAWAHYTGWVIYYVEALPVVGFVAASGLANVTRWIAARRSALIRWLRPVVGVAMAGLVAYNVKAWADLRHSAGGSILGFRELVERMPFEHAVVFIRYGDRVYPHITVAGNSATLATDPVWVVNDDPQHNMALVHAAGDRVPILYLESGQMSIYRALIDSLRMEQASHPTTGHQ